MVCTVYNAALDHGLTEHEFDHVLVGTYTEDNMPVNPEEVMAYRWIALTDLQQQLIQQPELFTAWLPQVIALVSTKLGVGVNG